ncbi:hypothetical protein B5X24_HaOG201005 [Helicoverpa armigera]|nr:hypothetical protein B5X24_HaOG201005 [Helicoverpa armigera]
MTESGIPLTNKLSKEVQQIFQPLYLMQMLVLNPRYQLSNNFIHPNMWLNKFILLTSLGLYVSFSLYRIFDIYLYFDLTMFLLGNYLQFASYFNLVFYCVGFIINFTNLFIHSKRYVAFVLIFQRIHTCIGNKASFKSAVNISRIYVSIFFGAYFLMSCFVITIFKQTSWVIVFNTAIMLTIDANMIYAITLIHLLTNEVKLWNSHISMFSKKGSDEDQHKIMFETYLHIAKSHRICRTVFQYMVRYFIILSRKCSNGIGLNSSVFLHVPRSYRIHLHFHGDLCLDSKSRGHTNSAGPQFRSLLPSYRRCTRFLRSHHDMVKQSYARTYCVSTVPVSAG